MPVLPWFRYDQSTSVPLLLYHPPLELISCRLFPGTSQWSILCVHRSRARSKRSSHEMKQPSPKVQWLTGTEHAWCYFNSISTSKNLGNTSNSRFCGKSGGFVYVRGLWNCVMNSSLIGGIVCLFSGAAVAVLEKTDRGSKRVKGLPASLCLSLASSYLRSGKSHEGSASVASTIWIVGTSFCSTA